MTVKSNEDIKVTLKKAVFGIGWEGGNEDYRMYEFPFYIYNTKDFRLAQWLRTR